MLVLLLPVVRTLSQLGEETIARPVYHCDPITTRFSKVTAVGKESLSIREDANHGGSAILRSACHSVLPEGTDRAPNSIPGHVR
jgi:hypothetical protein